MKSVIMAGKDTNLNSLFKRFLELESIEIEAGYISNKMHPSGELTYPQLARLQQNGSAQHKIPARPFLTDGLVIMSDEGKSITAQAVHKFLKGSGLGVFKSVEKISKESIMKAITNQRFIRLSPVTLDIRKSKGNHSTTILIDEGFLINNIETHTKN